MSGLGFRIDEIWAFVAVHGDTDEGIIGAMMPNGQWIPFIAADQTRLEQLIPIARQQARENNIAVRLVKFSSRELVETFHPDGRRERAG